LSERQTRAGAESAAPEWAPLFDAALSQSNLMIANSRFGRWLSAGDARDALRECHRCWQALLAHTGDLTLRAVGERLEGNGCLASAAACAPDGLMERMNALDTRCLVFRQGLGEPDLAKALEILGAEKADLDALGGFAETAKRVGLEGVTARSIVLREVAEDEQVIRREALERAAGDPRLRAGLLAFLSGRAAQTDPGVSEFLLNGAASDDALAGALSEAAGVAPEAGAEERARALTESARRVFGLWMSSPEGATQKGRRAFARRLRLLRESLAGQLGDPGGAGEALLNEACEEMDDELKMESLTSEFIKRQRAMSESEGRILRYMRRRGLEGLTESEIERRMREGGLDASEWRHLLARSGLAGGQPLTGLSRRLSQLQVSLQQAGGRASNAGELADELKTLAVQVEALTEDTTRKVRDIIEEYREENVAAAARDERDGPPAPPRLSRKQLYQKLSEIAQEICQPLSVINCSVTMITTGKLGALTPPQTDILKLAVESAQKLKAIVDSLMQMTGVPDALEPNARIQREIYGSGS
jgi:hypothetical protein